MNSYIILEDGVAGLINFEPFAVSSTHPNFDAIVRALKEERWSDIKTLANVAIALKEAVDEQAAAGGAKGVEVDVDAGVVRFDGEVLHGTLVDRILNMVAQGFKIDPLVKFLDNLMKNPSKRAVDELYGFLEYGKMPITEDGCFLAYKRVNSDYTSVHDNKTDNSIGKVVEMPRNKVDDRSDNTCSHGLHFCSHEYLKSFSGAKVVVLKINPADVVSIPTDYNNTKGRACRYEVVGELSPEEVSRALDQNIWADRPVVDDYDEDDWDDSDWPTDDEWDAAIDNARDALEEDTDDDGDVSDLTGKEYDAGYQAGYQAYQAGHDFTKPNGTTDYRDGWEDGYLDGRDIETVVGNLNNQ